MRVVSINSGRVLHRSWRQGTQTAILKTPISDKQVEVTTTGIVGDEQADLKNHGGNDKAILILPASAYQRFEVEGHFGFLGENLTIEGADEEQICLGDRLQIGPVLLEVSQPRSPCWKLDQQVAEQNKIGKLSSGEFLKRYSESGHVGFYCRVLVEGAIGCSDSVIWMTRAQKTSRALTKWPAINIKQLFLAKHRFQEKHSKKVLQNAIKHPALSEAWRQEVTQLLTRLR